MSLERGQCCYTTHCVFQRSFSIYSSEKQMLSSGSDARETQTGLIKSVIFQRAKKNGAAVGLVREESILRGSKTWEEAVRRSEKEPQFRAGLPRPAGPSLRLLTEPGLTISRTHDDLSPSAS